MPWFTKFLIKAGILIVLVNIAGLWVTVYLQQQHLRLVDNDQQIIAQMLQKSGNTSLDPRLSSVETKQQQLIKDVGKLDDRVDELSNSQPVVSQSSGNTGVGGGNLQSSQQQTEYTLYIGSGSTNKRDWTTIDAASITIDTHNYQNIKAVYFESGLSVIGGEVYARLINTGSDLPNYSSALKHNNQTATWKTAQINLDDGNHTYAVQLRTSSGETAQLTGARIRIIAD